MDNAHRLIRQAESYFKRSRPIPLTLFAKLMDAGIDVTELERKSKP